MRASERTRITNETNVTLALDLDAGDYTVDTGIGFFNHMMDLFAKHSGFGLMLKAEGDLEVDGHHTVEDVGILLGEALNEALGDKKGIARYASFEMPMDETLVGVAVDISGRAAFVYNAGSLRREKTGDFDTELAEEFFKAFAQNAKIALHINVRYGTNSHHIIEAMFKGVARALAEASRVRGDTIPSTKGTL